nr:hypothetical protein [Bacillus sp. FJAT-27245]
MGQLIHPSDHSRVDYFFCEKASIVTTNPANEIISVSDSYIVTGITPFNKE